MFGSLMRDMERDPIFGAHHRAMNRMMNSFFGGPAVGGGGFVGGMGLMGPPPMGHHPHHHHHQEEHDDLMPFGGGALSPFGAFGLGGFPDMSRMMAMEPSNGQHAFSSSSFVSISSGPDGRPQVYQASAETRHGPDGLKETRKALSDTRSGTKKMAVGRHMGEKGHIVEREQNLRTGQLNENHEFYNLQEEEAPHFDREWKQRAHGAMGQYAHSSSMPAIASSAHTVSPGPSRTSSYIEQSPEEVEEEEQYVGYQPQHSQSSVTIEELPASDDETEQMQQQSRSSRRSHPHHVNFSTVQAPPAASSSRRSPYGPSKDKRQKRAKAGKKY